MLCKILLPKQKKPFSVTAKKNLGDFNKNAICTGRLTIGYLTNNLTSLSMLNARYIDEASTMSLAQGHNILTLPGNDLHSFGLRE